MPAKNCAPDANGYYQGWGARPLIAWLKTKQLACLCGDDPCDVCVEHSRLIGEIEAHQERGQK